MRKKADIETATVASAESAKSKPGRKAMTPEEKERAAKARALEKEKAQNMRPEIFVQYQGSETSMDVLLNAIKENFHKERNAH